ncbi:MAG: response regulator transcription factor [Anaerolineae bacterium]|nr:response regulator transcription factor [Anaerolineae bacterium]
MGLNFSDSSESKILIVDACPAYCHGLVDWLEQSGYLASAYDQVEEIDEQIYTLCTQVNLLIVGPTVHVDVGFGLCNKLIRPTKGKNLKAVIALPRDADPTFQCDAAYVYASACLAVNTPREEFLRVVQGVLAGGSFIDSNLYELAFSDIKLTTSELEVLKKMAECKTDREIANALNKTHGTVRSQVKAVLSKFEVNSKAKAVNRARLRGLL